MIPLHFHWGVSASWNRPPPSPKRSWWLKSSILYAHHTFVQGFWKLWNIISVFLQFGNNMFWVFLIKILNFWDVVMVPISPSSRYFGFYRPFYERIRLELKPRPDKFTCSSKPVSRCHFTLTCLPTFKVSECFWRRAGGVEELRTCGVFVCVCVRVALSFTLSVAVQPKEVCCCLQLF